ncbi:MAG: hypothetical protein COA71_05390 [SAR86 cluster bacterium]|uniref:Cobalt transporter n=1 Tax=SAR86 cluster bacterium TaxID=2030880 RepID=A0A2A5CGE0_9GAMM|nr:MAG: hypothetical protein COA71_05390 [SAR86 cluster bacterium]
MKSASYIVLFALLTFSALPTQSLSQDANVPPAFTGMDEGVNETLAEEAGLPARDPFINLEALGEVWSMILLLAGGICGFILGRNWDLLWGKKTGSSSQQSNPDEDKNNL